eukprot:Sspe_Gene.89464::Locus_61232_Transcript_1_4_Confidence_0.333_Length_944::g.89464::m.89464
MPLRSPLALLLLVVLAEGANVTASRCTLTPNRATCSYKVTTLQARDIFYELPDGVAPQGGWPVMIQFHGWNMGGKGDWDATSSSGAGRYNKVAAKKALLDAGIAVFAPDSNQYRDGGYWETNLDPYASADLQVWESSDDHRFMMALLGEMERGVFGKLDVTRVHAMGFSSGGFMASRMAFNYPQRFRTVTVVAAGPAWCDGWWCPSTFFDETQPAAAMKTHPPTLHLHGTRDSMCYPRYAEDYHTRLQAAGRKSSYVTENVGHQWPVSSPTRILDWVRTHN